MDAPVKSIAERLNVKPEQVLLAWAKQERGGREPPAEWYFINGVVPDNQTEFGRYVLPVLDHEAAGVSFLTAHLLSNIEKLLTFLLDVLAS